LADDYLIGRETGTAENKIAAFLLAIPYELGVKKPTQNRYLLSDVATEKGFHHSRSYPELRPTNKTMP